MSPTPPPPPGFKLIDEPDSAVPPPPPGFKLVSPSDDKESFLEGAWKNLNPMPMLKSVYESATKPPSVSGAVSDALLGPVGSTVVDLARKHIPPIIQAQKDQFSKAGEAWNQGEHVQAAGHALAGALPVVGPAAAAAGETIGGTPPVYDKYGKILEPAKEPNLAGGLGEAAGLIAPYAAKPIVNATSRAIAKSPIPGALESAANTQYSRVLNATTRGNKARSAEVTPGLIDRGVTAMTMKGLQAKSAGQVAQWGEAIGNAWDNLPTGTKVEFQPIFDKIQAATNAEHTVLDSTGKAIPKGPEAARALKNIDSLQTTLLDVAEQNPTSGKLEIPVEKLRDLRQYFDNVSKQAGRFEGKDLADQSMAAAHGMAADAIREELGKTFPDIAALNKEFSFWKDVNRVVSDTILRREGQARPLGQKLMGAAGAAAGFGTAGIKGAALGKAAMQALESATTSPAWQTVSAVLKDRLAMAIAAGDQGPINFYIGKIADAEKVAPVGQTPPVRMGITGKGADERPPQFAKGGVVAPKSKGRYSKRGIYYGPKSEAPPRPQMRPEAGPPQPKNQVGSKPPQRNTR